MKTNQNLTRHMGEFEVTQRTSDGYFDGNALLLQWNANSNNAQKRIGHYTENEKTSEFINEMLRRNSDNGDFQPIVKVKGKMTLKGKTPDKVWMHPYLFIDFSMWLSPSFKYDVLKFVYDQLLKYRNEAGDAYLEMCSHIASILNKKENTTACISKVAKALNYIVYNQHETEIRNKQANEVSAKELSELEKEISNLIKRGFIKTFSQLIDYLRMLWSEKYLPKELN